MKWIYILYVAAVTEGYDYAEHSQYEKLDVCTAAAVALTSQEAHAFCMFTYKITQPDGTVRPIARPTQ